MEKETLAPSRALGIKLVRAILNILKDTGGEMSRKDLIGAIEQQVQFTDWERSLLEKSGEPRWKAIFPFYSLTAMRIGYLIKNNGVWYITPEGGQALKIKSDIELAQTMRTAHKSWKAQQPSSKDEVDIEGETGPEFKQLFVLDEIEQLAFESLENAINAKGPYEFQELVAALLRGMGYFTPFVAPRGKDGGIDVIAYGDPLGTRAPRIKVQVKHRENTASVKEVRELVGVLQKEGEVGIFVSSGGFGPDAKTAAVNSHVHIELIDLPRFINLWRDFYDKLEEADKTLLPLRGVYFHAPSGG